MSVVYFHGYKIQWQWKIRVRKRKYDIDYYTFSNWRSFCSAGVMIGAGISNLVTIEIEWKLMQIHLKFNNYLKIKSSTFVVKKHKTKRTEKSIHKSTYQFSPQYIWFVFWVTCFTFLSYMVERKAHQQALNGISIVHCSQMILMVLRIKIRCIWGYRW